MPSIKTGFHMSGKSQTIGDFTVCRPSQILPIYRIFARGLCQIFLIICDRGTGAQQFRGWSAESKIHDRLEFSRHMKMERSVSVSSEGIFEITSGGGPLISVGVFPPKFAGFFFDKSVHCPSSLHLCRKCGKGRKNGKSHS